MKKFLVMLLACAMIFGFASTAFAADTQIEEFSDIADQSQVAKTAIMKLAILGVVEGNDGIGGPFRPTENLTRAEFAKIVCYLTGSVKMADSLATVGSRFTDVSTGNWYTGWVNAAAQSGYYVGDPGGTFRPNANITMQEIVTVVLRAAGYTDRLPGAWPGNYVTKATNVGLLDDVTFVGSAAATRADMAIICNEVLGINMVEYIDNEIAAGLGRASGDVDKDGYAEVNYVSNENDGVGKETILHKAFKGTYYTVQFDAAPVGEDNDLLFDEISAWEYSDFNGGELQFNINDIVAYGDENDTYTDATDVATSYYINKDYRLTDLGGLLAQIIVIDGDEINFVDVKSSFIESTAVYKDASGKVNVDGKTYQLSNMGVEKGSAILDYTEGATIVRTAWADSDKDNAFPGKVYLDKNGNAYGVKNYEVYEKMDFGIVDSIESSIMEFKNAPGKDLSLNITKDYVIFKDGEMVKGEDLDENDVLYYLGESDAAKIFLATAPAEGDMSKQTDKKITIGGKTYIGATGMFQLSDDGGDSFSEFDITGADFDKSLFATVSYMVGYDFGSLAYVASTDEAVRIIGVVTDAPVNVIWSGNVSSGRYEKITIYNAEGKEVTYTYHKDFRDAYNAAFPAGGTANAAEMDDYIDGAKVKNLQVLKEGDIIQLEVDKNDAVKKLTNYIGLDETGSKEITVKPNTAKDAVTIDIKNGSSDKQNINKDAIIFNVTTTAVSPATTPPTYEYNEASIISVATLMAANHDATQFAMFDSKDKLGTDATVLYMVSNTSAAKLGFISNWSGGSSGITYVVDGEDQPGSSRNVTKEALYIYTLVDGEVNAGAKLADGDGYSLSNVIDKIGDAEIYDHFNAINGVVTDSSGSSAIAIGSKSYNVDSDTYIYDLGEGDVASVRDLRGQFVLVILDSNTAKYILAYGDNNVNSDDANTGVASVIVSDKVVSGSAPNFTVELPNGTTPTFIITPASSGANVSAVTLNATSGKWEFTVTAPNGTTKLTYTVTVTFAAVNPAAGAIAELAKYVDPSDLALANTTNTVATLIAAIKGTNAAPDAGYTVAVVVSAASGGSALDDTDVLTATTYYATITVTETGVAANTANKELTLAITLPI